MTTTVAICGSTGSIGTQTLDVIRAEPQRFRVIALGAASAVERLAAQAHEFRPEVVAVGDRSRAAELQAQVPPGTQVIAGPTALAEMSAAADTVVNGVVGFAGLPVTLAALEAGKRLALANKESLVAAGPVVQRARATPCAELIPVDSEHCALHQCLRANDNHERLRRLVLTASGGPFRGLSREELAGVSVDDALAHPTWAMGPKISVDSSTLMNKGLEVIEAHELFGVAYDRIDVVVHPQSVIHSMVEFSDGATIAQLSKPDMRLPIGYALAFPDRLSVPYGTIDWADVGHLDFETPDTGAFPCLGLGYEAGRLGETAPAWLSGANEVAVEAFLAGLISWVTIADVLTEVLDHWDGTKAESVDVVLDVDERARRTARAVIDRIR
ncbi:MAG: 1-deoxy-D-xylulose 5-phosphate reductoisomerase [Acidimicrobiales bacterium]|nr:MAG: 1-deoxy-D-xylulose-5-phosphate reductoisomerase [Actinomycetota bacterium]MBV6509180.1 1-deoxy-D-xylulose 5-phosphate reductoisomerase [Acidimicrobiales bacterium]RIK08474.1 MAG: 1-deoxy-D-xylulose-5-phosphate reductoisomerase [Acidobacteriota bacterium]